MGAPADNTLSKQLAEDNSAHLDTALTDHLHVRKEVEKEDKKAGKKDDKKRIKITVSTEPDSKSNKLVI